MNTPGPNPQQRGYTSQLFHRDRIAEHNEQQRPGPGRGRQACYSRSSPAEDPGQQEGISAAPEWPYAAELTVVNVIGWPAGSEPENASEPATVVTRFGGVFEELAR